MPHLNNALDHLVMNEHALECQVLTSQTLEVRQFMMTENELGEAIRLEIEAVTK